MLDQSVPTNHATSNTIQTKTKVFFEFLAKAEAKRSIAETPSVEMGTVSDDSD